MTNGEAGFICLKAADLEAGDTVTLTYVVQVNAAAPANSNLVNTATVTSNTPDEDPTNNEDTSITRTPAPPVVPPIGDPPPEYPGPFTPPAPPLNPPDEVLGLALTGTSSGLLGLLAAAMLAIGGLLTVGARRSGEDD